MKRSVLLIVCIPFMIFSLIINQGAASAQVNETELQQFLVSIHWTTDELDEYLKFYDRSINDFDSLKELEEFLGTPINNENLNDLLGKYSMDYSDLQTLLAEYGEKVNDYHFIEDLELDIDFYLRYQEDFAVVNDFLSLMGLTEDETQKLFDHFSSLEDEALEQRLGEITASLEALSHLRGIEKLSTNEQQQLFSFWQEMFDALQLQVTFSLVKNDIKTEVELDHLIGNEALNGNSLHVSLLNYRGEELATLNYSEEVFDSHLMYESLEQTAEIASLAQEYQTVLKVAKLPTTAGHYVSNILLSIFLIISGFAILLVTKRRVTT